MPYKYIGRTTDFKGKSLWELLGNLNNNGVGRIIGRNMFRRYPEPCYIKVLKVESLPNPKEADYNIQRKVIVLCERIFRGVKAEKLVQLESSTYKSDYFLVPKHEEKDFCRVSELKEMKILPKAMELPPLVKEYVKRQMKAAGKPLETELKMDIKYNLTGVKNYRVAKEGEVPTEPEFKLGYGKSVAPRLLANIKEC